MEYSRHEDRKDMNSRRVTGAFPFATNAVFGFHVWINQTEAAEARPTGTVVVSGSQPLRYGAAEEQHRSLLHLGRSDLEREIVAQRCNSRWRGEVGQLISVMRSELHREADKEKPVSRTVVGVLVKFTLPREMECTQVTPTKHFARETANGLEWRVKSPTRGPTLQPRKG